MHERVRAPQTFGETPESNASQNSDSHDRFIRRSRLSGAAYAKDPSRDPNHGLQRHDRQAAKMIMTSSRFKLHSTGKLFEAYKSHLGPPNKQVWHPQSTATKTSWRICVLS